MVIVEENTEVEVNERHQSLHENEVLPNYVMELFSDDFKCSHGCTIGQLGENALFYLQSGGIPKKEAMALLLYACANNVLASLRI